VPKSCSWCATREAEIKLHSIPFQSLVPDIEAIKFWPAAEKRGKETGRQDWAIFFYHFGLLLRAIGGSHFGLKLSFDVAQKVI